MSHDDPPWVRRCDLDLLPDPARVVSRIFLPGQAADETGSSRAGSVLARIMALTDDEVDAELDVMLSRFQDRHRGLGATWEANFRLVEHRLARDTHLPVSRRRLIGAYFTQETTVEGAGLLNPSMVPHPDQRGLPPGATRFVMTLRAIGEGHVSSLELRTGVVGADDSLVLDAPPAVAVLALPALACYTRRAFAHHLHALDDDPADADFVLDALPEEFSSLDLAAAVERMMVQGLTRDSAARTAANMRRVAANTYAVEFPADSALQERVLWPQAPAESQGIEDVRMVLCTRLNGSTEYLGTYTAYDGRGISLQLLRTADFRAFASTPLSGPGAQNKGVALFPRPVGGRYLALSRADRENNAVTASDDLLHWEEPVRIQTPVQPWEIVQLGNCGPPIETEHGWLVLTHGVGPMRSYSIGALLLDLEDPTVVIGHLEQPLLTPTEDERSGYVPNVVYSCGPMAHGRTLVVPYGCSDARTRVAMVDLDALLEALHGARVESRGIR